MFKDLRIKIIKNYEKLLLGLILFLASFLRLYRISDYMTFLGDEGRDVLIVRHILEGKFTLLGPTSSVGGFFLGPIYYYLMAPFLWLFKYNPAGPAVMVALFGIATVWFTYKIGSEFFNKKAGLIAALLCSVSPVVIAYSRSSWNPNLMPFFSLLTLYTLYKGVKDKKSYLFFLSGLFLGVTMQLHYLATFLMVIFYVYIFYSDLVIYKSLLRIKQLPKILAQYFYTIIGFLIGFSPFLAFEVRHGYPNIRSIFNFVFHSKDVTAGGNFFAIIGSVFFRLFGRLMVGFPFEQLPKDFSLNLQSLPIIILAVFGVGVFVFEYFSILKKRDEKVLKLSLIFTWFFLGVIFFGLYKKPIYDYYFEFIFPLPFLLVGNAFSFLLKRPYVYLKAIAVISLVALFAINIQGIPFRYAPNRQYEQAETIAKFVYDKAGGKPFNFALITGGNSDFAYRYFFETWGNTPVVIQNSVVDPKRTTVTDQLLVVCESLPCYPLGNSLWEIAGFGRAEIKGEWNVSVVKVYKLEHFKEK